MSSPVNDSPKPRPYPTPTRLQLLEDIAGGKVEHYPFITPQTSNQVTGNLVTARVKEFVSAGLVDYGVQADDSNRSTVRLTEAGQKYLDTYGKNGATS